MMHRCKTLSLAIYLFSGAWLVCTGEEPEHASARTS